MSSSLGHCCCSERQYAGGAVYCGPPPRRPAAVAAAAMRHSVPLGAGPLRSQALQFVTLSVWPGLVWGGGCCDHFSVAQRLLAGLFVCVPAWLSVAGSDCLLSSAVEGGWGGGTVASVSCGTARQPDATLLPLRRQWTALAVFCAARLPRPAADTRTCRLSV